MTEIRPFVTWEIPTFEQIQDCKAVALRRGIDNGYKLTREDKDWITANVNGNSYFKNAIPILRTPFRHSATKCRLPMCFADTGCVSMAQSKSITPPTRPHSATICAVKLTRL